jgi:solute:Na+ symporter, SSS family
LFFGALLSAILSTASGALLAPTSLFTENVLRPLAGDTDDRKFLITLRIVLVVFSICALMFALNSKSTMYEMVQSAYKVTLVGALVPLVLGMFWSRATTQGALCSVIVGLTVWGASEQGWIVWSIAAQNPSNAQMPAQIVGFVAALVAMLVGSLLPQIVPNTNSLAKTA